MYVCTTNLFHRLLNGSKYLIHSRLSRSRAECSKLQSRRGPLDSLRQYLQTTLLQLNGLGVMWEEEQREVVNGDFISSAPTDLVKNLTTRKGKERKE